jgi:hypothetical protein
VELEDYDFQQGAAVILKQRRTGGLRLPAQGPYRFIRYSNKQKRTAVIQNPETGTLL